MQPAGHAAALFGRFRQARDAAQQPDGGRLAVGPEQAGHGDGAPLLARIKVQATGRGRLRAVPGLAPQQALQYLGTAVRIVAGGGSDVVENGEQRRGVHDEDHGVRIGLRQGDGGTRHADIGGERGYRAVEDLTLGGSADQSPAGAGARRRAVRRPGCWRC